MFTAKPHYTFENREGRTCLGRCSHPLDSDTNLLTDCMRFQEKILNQTLVFMAGVAEVKSKGRGEECISQNLRILRAKNGRQAILLFANSQRKEKKRYFSIPCELLALEKKSTNH